MFNNGFSKIVTFFR